MIYDGILKDNELTLRNLTEDDCTQEYADWLNDKEVNQFLESHWKKESVETCKNFIKSINESSHSYLFGIFVNDKHIGNIKLGPIHQIYMHGDLSYFIGNLNYQSKGYATKAIKLMCDFAFNEIKLNRINAGCCVLNPASKKVLVKNGFKLEGRLRKIRKIEPDSDFYDGELFGLLKEEYK